MIEDGISEKISEDNWRVRLAVVASHPVQYYAPWFRLLADTPGLGVRVFYLWDFGVDRGGGKQTDAGFRVGVTWDLPLLEGYEHEFVPNAAREPGTHRFAGLDNPSLGRRLAAFAPDAVLVFGYAHKALQRLIWLDRVQIPALRRARWLFRGDSHDLAGRGASFKERSKERLKRRLTAAAFGRFDGFLAVGKANAEYFRARGVPGGRIAFAPHCVDNARFAAEGSPAAGSGAAGGTRHTRRRRRRPVRRQVRAEEGPGRCGPGLPGGRRAGVGFLLLVGAGALGDAVRAAAGGDARVRFLGFRNQTEMPAAYAAADLLVLPSVGRSETWGLCVNEAFACGTPAIVSDRVGCGPDLVDGRATGAVVPAGDTPALAAALRTALSDRETLNRWGRNARGVVAGYSYEAARDGLLTALGRVRRPVDVPATGGDP